MIRIIDLFLASIGLIFLWPLMIIICIAGMFDTGSPIFIQTRVGRYKKPFKLIKFRTMPLVTESVATHLVGASSVTKLGGLLRKTKLDELPQLINVLKGDMSLVGPRPSLFNQIELIDARQKRGVLDVLPGVTGLAQINEVDMSTPVKLAKWDQKMLQTLSVSNYFRYIIMTAVGKGSGDRVK
ncbi:sugar transferase [Corallincola platygyrae]|uniref:Sugar transferase n=1 Tax=Corallincola platygyrae TaxID=1193278 RepID=A0ABW4XJB3_9GAMM